MLSLPKHLARSIERPKRSISTASLNGPDEAVKMLWQAQHDVLIRFCRLPEQLLNR